MNIKYNLLFHQLIFALSKVLDINEARKLNHAQRTAALSCLMADEFCPTNKTAIYYAALLHDIGGIGLFDSIVHHPSRVMQAANPAIRVHPVVGAQIVDSIPGLEICVPIILDHHECYDSHGYPGGKVLENISLESQILGAADSFDILIHRAQGVEAGKLSKAFAYKAGRSTSQKFADFVCHCIDDPATFSFLMDDQAIEDRCLELHKTLPMFKLPKGDDIVGILLEVFAQVIDTKHSYTAGHSKRVSKYSMHIGLQMGLGHDEVTKLKWAALIHDLGKVAIPKTILDGTTRLETQELNIMRRHPEFTRDVLSCVSELDELGRIGAFHHERWDGKGYPDGLEGEQTPLLSRIICIADAFDSLTSDRSYRKGRGTKDAIEQLAKASGTQFDPEIFAVAKTVLWSGVN